jgi:hypothetical protein
MPAMPDTRQHNLVSLQLLESLRDKLKKQVEQSCLTKMSVDRAADLWQIKSKLDANCNCDFFVKIVTGKLREDVSGIEK